MAPKNSASSRRETVSAQPATRSGEPGSLELTLAELNQIQRSMGVGAAKRWSERIYIQRDTPSYQFRD